MICPRCGQKLLVNLRPDEVCFDCKADEIKGKDPALIQSTGSQLLKKSRPDPPVEPIPDAKPRTATDFNTYLKAKLEAKSEEQLARSRLFWLDVTVVLFVIAVLGLYYTHGLRLFGFETSAAFDFFRGNYYATFWPIYLFSACLALRWGIYRFVVDHDVKRLARQYWLYIAAYLALLVVYCDLTGSSLWLFAGTSFVILLLLYAGLTKIFIDIVASFFEIAGAGLALLNIGWRWLVYWATLFAKWLWSLRAKMIEWYDHKVSQPLKLFFERVSSRLAKWKDYVGDLTSKIRK